MTKAIVQAKWDEALVTRFTALVEQGLSASKIGLALNLNKNQVIGKAHRLGLFLGANRAKPLPEREDAAAEKGAGAKNAVPKAAAKSAAELALKEDAKPASKLSGRIVVLTGLRFGRGVHEDLKPPRPEAPPPPTGARAVRFLDQRPGECKTPLWVGAVTPKNVHSLMVCGNPVDEARGMGVRCADCCRRHYTKVVA